MLRGLLQSCFAVVEAAPAAVVAGGAKSQSSEKPLVVIREFDPERDTHQVETLERLCEVGPSNTFSVFTDLLGDPLGRIRYSPQYVMLVAEYGSGGMLVGFVRGSIKTVMGGPEHDRSPRKVAYILGLRVLPTHRRMGIAKRLVQELEQWLTNEGAEYAYMATEQSNEASLKLFTEKLDYKKFRTPAILVHPVHAHAKKLSSDTRILKLNTESASELYKTFVSNREFFPADMAEAVLANKLNLGTWVAFSGTETGKNCPNFGNSGQGFVLPQSWAMLSVWNSAGVFKFEVAGASLLSRWFWAATRFVDRRLPFLQIPSVPDVTAEPFGVYVLFGVHAEGPRGADLARQLWCFCHNQARSCSADGIRFLAVELASMDPVRPLIPQWPKLSCEQDIWCIKKLHAADKHDDDDEHDEWIKSRPPLQMFVDPRDF